MLDGVYRRTDGEPVFVEVPAPTNEALRALLHKIIGRLMKLLTRRGVLIEEEDGSSYLADSDADSDEARTLRPHAGGRVASQAAPGQWPGPSPRARVRPPLAACDDVAGARDNLPMPELPEVEVTRRSLVDVLAGARIVELRMGAALRWPLGVEPSSLRGWRLGDMQRRGKYLWLPLLGDDGSRAGLLLHLGMSGSLTWSAQATAPGRHDHFDLLTSRGLLRLTDPRRFGAVVWSSALDVDPAAKLLSRLGYEPFDPSLDAKRFHQALRTRSAPIKNVLLAGDIVVGAGNIYACEALFHAGINPRTRSHRVSAARSARLLAAVRQVLGRALELGGTTLRDFRDAQGHSGAYQQETRVYAREGLSCTVCATPVRRIVQGQRSTFFCPTCQKR